MTIHRVFAAFIVWSLVACGSSAPAPSEPDEQADQEEEAAPTAPKAPAPVVTSRPQSGYAIAN